MSQPLVVLQTLQRKVKKLIANILISISAMQKPPKQRGRKPKLHREDRVKSPSGHKAVIEDIGYSNAHIFTRFYQGQNVHGNFSIIHI